MNTKLLKQKILDLAIRGKLVPQDPNDEPASVLLGRIKAEKERLIAEGKIKRSKKSAQTSDKPHYENVTFEVPAGWEWCIVDDIAYVASGSTPEKSAFVPDGIPYIKMYNLKNQKIDFESHPQYIKEEVHNGNLQRSRTEVGDLIMNIVGPPLGKLAIIPPSLPQSNFNQAAVLIRPYLHKGILVKYLFYYLSEMSEINSISTKGSAGQVNISLTQCQNMRIALPPIQEQQRIVSELDKYFAIVDDLEWNKDELVDIIKLTKTKVLDLAIRGKLVAQDPTDEPASELLKRINPDAKPCDTSHYENLPKSWGVATIDQVCSVIGGLWTGKKPPFIKVGVIRNTNFSKDFKLDLSNVAYLEVEVRQFEKRRLQYGDLILEKSGGSDKQPVGRVVLYDKNDGEFSYSNFTSVLRINMQSVISPQYLYLALLNAYLMGSTRTMQKQTTGIHNLMMEKYLTLDIAIPPRKEQNRIVESVNILFKMLDDITAEL